MNQHADRSAQRPHCCGLILACKCSSPDERLAFLHLELSCVDLARAATPVSVTLTARGVVSNGANNRAVHASTARYVSVNIRQ